MKKFCLILLLFSCTAKKENTGNVFKTLKGEEKKVSAADSKKGSIYIFLLPDCPFSQFYSIAVDQVYSIYNKKGYDFYGIVPGSLYSVKEIDSFKEAFNFIPEILIDPDQTFTKSLGVKVVPQVVFLDTKGNVLYSGKIDDQAVQTGQKKYMPGTYYLLNAIKEHQSGSEISLKSTKAVGCFIED